MRIVSIVLIGLIFIVQGYFCWITPLNLNKACLAEALRLTNKYKCDSKGNIICLTGWSNPKEWCKIPICNLDGYSCQNGNCILPNTCACHVGWDGSICDKCIPRGGCRNGDCDKPFECNCSEGWFGYNCDKAKCDFCKNGKCLEPNKCICNQGWEGDQCDQCVKKPGCQNGYCQNKPHECKCREGWKGDLCNIPICLEECDPKFGFCDKPGECKCITGWTGPLCTMKECSVVCDLANSECEMGMCVCKEGWTGAKCDECIPKLGCVNGECKDQPFECVCKDGYEGELCNNPICLEGCNPMYGSCDAPGECNCSPVNAKWEFVFVIWDGSDLNAMNASQKRIVLMASVKTGLLNAYVKKDMKENYAIFLNVYKDVIPCLDHVMSQENANVILDGLGPKCDECLPKENCANGECKNEPFECVCNDGWDGDLCDVPICREGCNPQLGSCNAPGECNCIEGSTGVNCNECIKKPGCVNGECKDKPFECVCKEGYEGELCDIPKCRQGCHPMFGSCDEPGECKCNIGWTGPKCDECLPKENCANGCNPQLGSCNAPGECNCMEGSTGVNCNECIKKPGCVNGECNGIPFGCVCNDGWDGDLCDIPICSEGCNPKLGFCNAPGECNCIEGSTGVNCNECIKKPGCLNGECNGIPFGCVCNDGWAGKFCEKCIKPWICTPSISHGEWSEWSHWSDCYSKSCYSTGHKFRRRLCTFNKTYHKVNPHYHHEVYSPKVKYCPGASLEKKPCSPDYCQKKGHKFQFFWSEWTPCTAQCKGHKGVSIIPNCMERTDIYVVNQINTGIGKMWRFSFLYYIY
ncbi:unnamed protein product [Lepeophtheirus salmonis]|uniref:(salmon louse) hypothetical protein n=1 Tax=Lepeophtheirus salmonis TaxID=72036 RepID=A0A7R8CXH5_LEPSM|nr:unnamed protein product [Lepeophtheirus salmonis]CAF2960548.1 unnamed protein product [Lepeophtheirus salmonis]